MIKSLLKGFVFANFWLAVLSACACAQTLTTFGCLLAPEVLSLVAFATLCSYSLHWALTGFDSVQLSESVRAGWTMQYRPLLCLLALSAGVGILVSGWNLPPKTWVFLAPLALLTGLYSLPKIPFWKFHQFNPFFIPKSLYLSLVWTSATLLFPLFSADFSGWNLPFWAYLGYRFSVIHSICLLFDYRDRHTDQKTGVFSPIAQLDEVKFVQFLRLFQLFGLVLGGICWAYGVLGWYRLAIFGGLCLFLPEFQKKRSDYWYYGGLDALLIC